MITINSASSLVLSFILGFVTCALFSSHSYKNGFDEGWEKGKEDAFRAILHTIKLNEMRGIKNYHLLVKKIRKVTRRY